MHKILYFTPIITGLSQLPLEERQTSLDNIMALFEDLPAECEGTTFPAVVDPDTNNILGKVTKEPLTKDPEAIHIVGGVLSSYQLASIKEILLMYANSDEEVGAAKIREVLVKSLWCSR